MSKEYLEALEHIYYGSQGYGEIDKYYKYLKEYLESIDNSEPSEALECLEEMWELSCDSRKPEYTLYETIKQALLKAQFLEEEYNNLMEDKDNLESELFKLTAPKHYLKWEDLEFEDFPKEIEVRIGDNICKLEYKVSWLGNKTVILMGNNKTHLQLFENEKQFFNDLYLERVEE